MLDLILAVGFAVLISAFCSVTEAVLYSVPWSRIEQLRKKGKPSGAILYHLRTNVQEPISAILTLNTIANTAGAAVAGAAAAEVFGGASLPYFTAVFTVIILIFSEILPKTVGVMYTRKLAPYLAEPLKYLVLAMKPAIWMLSVVAKLVEGKKKGHHTGEEDILAMVSLTRKAGVLKPYEESAIKNILSLDKKTVKDVMTPRTVVYSYPVGITVAEAAAGKAPPHSRIPVFDNDDPEDVVGVVFRKDILESLAKDEDERLIGDLMKQVRFVLENLTLEKLLITFLDTKMHLFVVIDEYGGLAGVVSLEDVLEEILGKEIVDETDEVADMRDLARRQRQTLTGSTSVGGRS